MIKGIGIDIIELSRIEELLKKQPRFIDRILTSSEKARFHEFSARRQTEFLAGRFAAKEAFSKAYGTGIGSRLSFTDIEIGTDGAGRPFFKKPDLCAHLSISHSRDYAAAQVIIEEF